MAVSLMVGQEVQPELASPSEPSQEGHLILGQPRHGLIDIDRSENIIKGELVAPSKTDKTDKTDKTKTDKIDNKSRENEELSDEELREYERALDEEIELLEKGLKREEVEEKLGKDCEKCGSPVKIKMEDMCLLGLDVVALFPSMSARKTGEIVRKRLMRSTMEFDGFDWRRGAAYIVINKSLTSQLGSLWKILPYRKKVGGTQPGMTSRAGWDETNFLGRDRDREIRLMKIHYETETEKKWMLIF